MLKTKKLYLILTVQVRVGAGTRAWTKNYEYAFSDKWLRKRGSSMKMAEIMAEEIFNGEWEKFAPGMISRWLRESRNKIHQELSILKGLLLDMRKDSCKRGIRSLTYRFVRHDDPILKS